MDGKKMLADLKSWQNERLAELAGPESWLGVRGLFWLEPGLNRVGAGADCGIRFPLGPQYLGNLSWQDGQVNWLEPGKQARSLATDRDGSPDTLVHDRLAFFIVERDGRLAVRLRDLEWAAGQPVGGLDYFDFDPAWQINAEWRALSTPLTMEVPTVSGELKAVCVTHQAVFERAGERIELLPMSVSEKEVFFVFRDQTSGRDTYGAGRFLKAAPATGGRIQLDFNRAYNPPCAFTPFAACPLPPSENWLAFAIPAGEKKWNPPAGQS